MLAYVCVIKWFNVINQKQTSSSVHKLDLCWCCVYIDNLTITIRRIPYGQRLNECDNTKELLLIIGMSWPDWMLFLFINIFFVWIWPLQLILRLVQIYTVKYWQEMRLISFVLKLSVRAKLRKIINENDAIDRVILEQLIRFQLH